MRARSGTQISRRVSPCYKGVGIEREIIVFEEHLYISCDSIMFSMEECISILKTRQESKNYQA